MEIHAPFESGGGNLSLETRKFLEIKCEILGRHNWKRLQNAAKQPAPDRIESRPL